MTYRRITQTRELLELPVGSVVLAQFPAGAMERFDSRWGATGSHVMYPAERVPLPAIVLWRPDVDDLP